MILIEKDKSIKETWKDPSYSDPLNVLTEIRDRLNALPTIEIVRCRECKHRIPAFGGFYMCKLWNQFIDDDFFCADGKRRDDDE